MKGKEVFQPETKFDETKLKKVISDALNKYDEKHGRNWSNTYLGIINFVIELKKQKII